MKGDGTSLYWKQLVQARPQTSFLLLDVKKHLFLLCSRQQVPPSVSIECVSSAVSEIYVRRKTAHQLQRSLLMGRAFICHTTPFLNICLYVSLYT